MGKYREALKCYSRVLSSDPGNGAAYYGRGMTYSLIGKDEEFMNDCRDAARLGYPDAVALLNRLNIKYR